MVVSRKAIEEFLERPLKNSRKAKRFSERVLDKKLKEANLEFINPPRYAQKVCLLLGWKYSSYLFLLGLAGGKTYLCLTLFRNLRLIGKAKRMFVLVPNVVNLTEWKRETKKHASDCSIAIFGEGEADIVVCTYQMLSMVCSDTVKRHDKKEWRMNRSKVARIAKDFDCLVMDEITSVRNSGSLWFQTVRAFRKHVAYCYGLTGTPFGKNPAALWSQFYLIDQGYALGETLGLYREVFFRKEEGYWSTTYEFRKRMKRTLSRRLAHCSIRFKESECQDLPASMGGIKNDWMLLPVPLPAAQQPYYDAIKEELNRSHGSFELCNNAYMRMRMVSSGWLGATTEDEERVEITFKDNPKLDAVIEKLREIPDGEKVIIAHWFHFSGKLIMERLKKEKLNALWIYGKTPKKAKLEGLDKFRDPKGPRILVASTAISKGVNLQDACRFMLFFESSDDPIDRTQMEGRIVRESQELPGTRYIYDAVCLKTKDESILKSMKEGRKLIDVIVDRKKGR